MRKFHIVLLCIFLVAIVMATYTTFFLGRKPAIISGPRDLGPDSAGISPRAPLGAPTDIKNFYELGRHNVAGRELVLLEVYSPDPLDNTRNIGLYEVSNGKYHALDVEYEWANAYIDDRTSDFWFDTENRNLYLGKFTNADEFYYGEDSEIVRVDYSDMRNIRVRQLGLIKNVYYGRPQFLDYSSKNNALITISQGGDACSGWGTVSIFNLNSNTSSEILEFGGACAEGTRYVEYEDGRLVLGEPGECDSEWTMSGSCLRSIYSIDPFNMNSREVIYTFSSPYEYDLSSTEEPISDNEIVISRTIQMPDGEDGTQNFRGDAYALNLVTRTVRDLGGDEEVTMSIFPDVEPTPEVLKETDLVLVTRLGSDITIENRSDTVYGYKVFPEVADGDRENFEPCPPSEGCEVVRSGDTETFSIENYINNENYDMVEFYWWDQMDLPQTRNEIPDGNYVRLWGRFE